MSEIKSIMLLGAAGQVGQAIQAQPLPADSTLHAVTRQDFDLTNVAALRNAVQQLRPRLIINCAGLTNVDQAEREPELARAVNFEAVANLAAQCAALDIPLIQLSTDYVFDGRANQPYQTEDAMNPVNQYGASKLLGEEAVRQTSPWHVILRVSSVFSGYSRNILTNLLQLAEKQPELRMVTDIRSSPTPAPAIASTVLTIAAALLDGKAGGYGTFHYCGQPEASRHEFAQAVLMAAKQYLSQVPNLLPALRAEFAGGAERPAYSVMDCSKLQRIYGITQPDWRAALLPALQQIYPSRITAA
jgi:dTDP-4-dehydrorhamnose reductase